ncbi:MAG: protein-tyrosine-phosphatase [Microscillaceae bacterium]|nr:protein-tyrosine-phosphatase [Microscillaceae bacterium]MDW8461075.1 protein-tyrosine-phosphatase [Cytophagales bacterium]
MSKYILLFIFSLAQVMSLEAQKLNAQLQKYCETLSQEFDQIPQERKENLAKISQYIQAKRRAKKEINLTFICTHNSRRSQFGQVWAKVASVFYGIDHVQTYSGGTEVTACNIRTVKALQRAGVQIETMNEVSASAAVANNPRYAVILNSKVPTFYLFSKTYDDKTNPQKNFCAILVCSQADEACPVVLGAETRIYHGYTDPKHSDNTPQENETYDQTCREIAREMFYVFSLIK